MEYRPTPGMQALELDSLNTAYLGGTHVDYIYEPAGVQQRTNGPSATSIRPSRRFALPKYKSALVQFVLTVFVGFFCFSLYRYCYLQISWLSSSTETAYSVASATVAFFGGPLVNRIGTKPALFFGLSGYPIYISAVLCFNYTENYGFMIFAGSFLGCAVGIYWCVLGQITMSYPTESFRGRYVSLLLLVSGLDELAVWVAYWKNNGDEISGLAVPIIFLVLTITGASTTWFLINLKDIIRSDGTRISPTNTPDFKFALKQLRDTFSEDTFIFCLFPVFFSSKWIVDGLLLRPVNSENKILMAITLSSTAQITGGIIFGFALDYARLRRPTRAIIAWVTLFISTFAIWGGTYAFQRMYSRADDSSESENNSGPIVLYVFHGFVSAGWQTCIWWIIGSLTVDTGKLAIFAGFFQGLGIAGSSTVEGLYQLGTASTMAFYTTAWFLLAVSLVIAAPVFLWMVTDPVADGPQMELKDDSSLVTEDHSRFGKSSTDIVLRPTTPLSRF